MTEGESRSRIGADSPSSKQNNRVIEYRRKTLDALLANLDLKEFTARAIQAIADEAIRHNKSKLLIPLSGGVDSATLAALAKRTSLDTLLVTVTSKYMRPSDINDARYIASELNLDHKIIDISIPCSLVSGDYPVGAPVFGKGDNGGYGKERIPHLLYGFIRAVVLELGGWEKRLVLGSGNKTELYSGLSSNNTLGMGQMFPFGDLYKTQVCTLAKYLGLPQNIVSKPSHGGIKGESCDEEWLGLPFSEIDSLLYLLCEEHEDKEMVGMLGGWSMEVMDDLIRRANKGKAKTKVYSVRAPKISKSDKRVYLSLKQA